MPDRPETYADRPRPLHWNLWLPGLVIAILAGVLAYARMMSEGVLGYAAFFGVPFAVGVILGFTTRSARALADGPCSACSRPRASCSCSSR